MFEIYHSKNVLPPSGSYLIRNGNERWWIPAGYFTEVTNAVAIDVTFKNYENGIRPIPKGTTSRPGASEVIASFDAVVVQPPVPSVTTPAELYGDGPYLDLSELLVGDGVQDVTSIIQDALDHSNDLYVASSGQLAKGATVMLPHGLHKISRTLNIPGHTRLVGNNTRNTVLLAADGFNDENMVHLGYGVRISSGSRIEYLTLNGDNKDVRAAYSNSLNEHSGVENCRSLRCGLGAFKGEWQWVDGQNTGAFQNSTIDGFDDLIDYAAPERIAFELVGPPSAKMQSFRRVTTYSNVNTGARNLYGVFCNGMSAKIADSHFESCDFGIVFRNSQSAVVDWVNGNPHTNVLVHLGQDMSDKMVNLSALIKNQSPVVVSDISHGITVTTDMASYTRSPAT